MIEPFPASHGRQLLARCAFAAGNDAQEFGGRYCTKVRYTALLLLASKNFRTDDNN
jgi:hypothetical protein